jgi:hypothetical protein
VKKYSTGFVHFFLLLIIALVAFAGIGYFAYKSGQVKINDSPSALIATSDWKKYEYKSYDFSFEYPAELDKIDECVVGPMVKESASKNLICLRFMTPADGSGNDKLYGLVISIQDMGPLSFHNYIENRKKIQASWVDSSIPTPQKPHGKEITKVIGGKEAVELDGYSWDELSRIYIKLSDSKVLFITKADYPKGSFNTFDQILSTFKFLESTSQPVVIYPSSNSKVTNPLRIDGIVPAGWMFEGVFPIKLVDSYKNIIAQGQAKEKITGSWQSGESVQFEATLNFTTSAKSGFLILENDNPSGLPENSKSFEIPVNF